MKLNIFDQAVKVKRVIESCETAAQFNTAKNYVNCFKLRLVRVPGESEILAELLTTLAMKDIQLRVTVLKR